MTLTELRSFLGLCNYFRDHIRHYTEASKPLYDLLKRTAAAKSKSLEWLSHEVDAFLNMKQLIIDCPTLYFIRDSPDPQSDPYPIFLHTDASDYGIGAYLFQIVQGEEKPVAFLSKSLSDVEQRWSTFEKEGYAIYYSLVKFQHLLRDSFFTLRTDHRNLTYINTESSQKVVRWKLYIQEYNFNVEHIAGELNVAADAFSRLCIVKPNDEQIWNLNEYQIPRERYDLIRKFHNSTVGHHGEERTELKIKTSGESWPFMKSHIRRFIDECPICQKQRETKPPFVGIRETISSYSPMERLDMDTIGPLEEDENGNKYILVIIDAFSRFVEFYPHQM
jgi:hypothetical protein